MPEPYPSLAVTPVAVQEPRLDMAVCTERFILSYLADNGERKAKLDAMAPQGDPVPDPEYNPDEPGSNQWIEKLGSLTCNDADRDRIVVMADEAIAEIKALRAVPNDAEDRDEQIKEKAVHIDSKRWLAVVGPRVAKLEDVEEAI